MEDILRPKSVGHYYAIDSCIFTDAQIAYVNAGMSPVHEFWCQTPPGTDQVSFIKHTKAQVTHTHIYRMVGGWATTCWRVFNTGVELSIIAVTCHQHTLATGGFMLSAIIRTTCKTRFMGP